MPYATPEQYRDRVSGTTDTVPDDLLEGEIAAASRIIDQMLEVVPTYFEPGSANATYVFAGRGGRTLRLRDDDGLAYALRSVTDGGIVPDYSYGDDAGDYAWDLDDAWLWPLARNAAALGRPYHAIEIRYNDQTPIGTWPTSLGSVSITGAWGWAATPPAIRDLTIKVARDLRDSMRAGAAARVQALDESVMFGVDDTWRLWLDVKRNFGRRRGQVARRSR